MSFPIQVIAAAAIGALVPVVLARIPMPLPDLPSFLSRAGETAASIAHDATAACIIKGNISINTGERIYHVPGQEHYDETIISPQYGERWFCTEAEAREAGWRKAYR
jgi:hypothetical protein